MFLRFLAVTENLLKDLLEYSSYKDTGVMMARAHEVNKNKLPPTNNSPSNDLSRTTCPTLLHKKDRV